MIDPRINAVLKNSGWHEGRSLNKNEIIKQVIEEGYPILEKAISFMQSFGGLLIHFDNLLNGIKNDTVNLDFENATHIESREKVENRYVPRIKKELCLIGSAYRDNLILLMSADGYVYGAYENYLCLISATGEGALESIILNKNFIEIPESP